MRKHRALIKEIGFKIRSLQQEQRQVITRYQRNFLRHKKKLQDWVNRQPSMAEKRVKCIEAVLKSNNQELLNKYLEGFVLRDYKIPLVGVSRMSKLQTANILTAADLQPQQLQVAAIPSNVATSLLKWRRRMERGFRGPQSVTISFQDQARVEQLHQQVQNDHQKKLALMQQPLVDSTKEAQRKMLATAFSILNLSMQKAQSEAFLVSFRSSKSP
jgi:DNA-binding helix-hairpin-helix protein with protein kinase domain